LSSRFTSCQPSFRDCQRAGYASEKYYLPDNFTVVLYVLYFVVLVKCSDSNLEE